MHGSAEVCPSLMCALVTQSSRDHTLPGWTCVLYPADHPENGMRSWAQASHSSTCAIRGMQRKRSESSMTKNSDTSAAASSFNGPRWENTLQCVNSSGTMLRVSVSSYLIIDDASLPFLPPCCSCPPAPPNHHACLFPASRVGSQAWYQALADALCRQLRREPGPRARPRPLLRVLRANQEGNGRHWIVYSQCSIHRHSPIPWPFFLPFIW